MLIRYFTLDIRHQTRNTGYQASYNSKWIQDTFTLATKHSTLPIGYKDQTLEIWYWKVDTGHQYSTHITKLCTGHCKQMDIPADYGAGAPGVDGVISDVLNGVWNKVDKDQPMAGRKTQSPGIVISFFSCDPLSSFKGFH